MKVDKNKLKKCSTDVPTDCRNLIEKIKSSTEDELLVLLQATTTWTVGKCELYHWVDVLDRFDSILTDASYTRKSDWLLAVNHDENLQNLTLAVLHFTSLLIEYSFSRHLYSSVEHLIKLLSSSNLDIILSVLNLLYVFSKRSNFLSRLTVAQRVPLLDRLGYLAESWGGKENGFGLAECCLDLPLSSYPSHATTLHYECYSDLTDWEKNANVKKQANNMFCIHIDNVHEHFGTCDEIMESLSRMFSATNTDSKMSLFTHLRLAYHFAQHNLRLKCVQARLHAISVLVYTNNVTENISGILYSGFTEELVDLLQVKDNTLVDIKAAALRTLTSIVHLDCRDRTPRLGAIVDVTGVAQYHGFLPVLVRRCIDSMTSKNITKEENPEFPHSFATALFSFLYHLSSYESGGEALVQSGMMGPLLSVVTSMGDQQEQTTFVTRAVRVIDLITNIDWQAFQAISGLQVFIDRLEHEVSICRHDAPPACVVLPGVSSTSNEDVIMEEEKDVEMDVEEGESVVQYKPGAQCLPQRAALFKSVLNFLKKAISEQAYGEQVRHMMDGTLPRSLKHIIGNVEYYGPALFLIAMEVATVYVFQEPSLLSSLQDSRLTDVMLHALLVKNPPATREVLASLPNIFSALCLNSRGLTAFVNCNPFDRLCHVMLSPEYLLAMKRRRTSDPLGDTASNLGNAMDELMRHQPSLRTATMEAILKMLKELHKIGSDPSTACSRLSSSKTDLSSNSNSDGSPGTGDVPSNDENTNQELDTTFIIRDNDDNEGSEDEVGEEVPATKPSTSAQTVSGSKKNVPLLDYIQNVTKFIQAIVSNNMTADHCFEFYVGGGCLELLKLLRLPSLPLDFPSSPACQAVTRLAQTVYSLLGKTNIVQDSFTHIEFLLKKLEPIFLKDDQNDCDERKLSVLLHELLLQRMNTKEEVKYVKELVQINSFVMMLLNLPRASQNEVRVKILKEWGTELGLKVINGLNKLYRSLIWESTVLLALCTPGSENDDSLVLFDEPVEDPNQQIAMEVNTAETSTKTKDPNKTAAAMAARVKCIKPILTVASKLGRSLAELFGLLGKLAVGRPIRQRFNSVLYRGSQHLK